MDMFPPLGMDGHLEMVVKPAAGVTMDVVSDAQTVIGVKVGAEARAYPIKLMNYHDVINDTLGGEPIAVVWSAPASAPSAMYRDQFTFGSAGLVFQGAIVMYSKDSVAAAEGKKGEEFSLWSPTMRLCIAGERAGHGSGRFRRTSCHGRHGKPSTRKPPSSPEPSRCSRSTTTPTSPCRRTI